MGIVQSVIVQTSSWIVKIWHWVVFGRRRPPNGGDIPPIVQDREPPEPFRVEECNFRQGSDVENPMEERRVGTGSDRHVRFLEAITVRDEDMLDNEEPPDLVSDDSSMSSVSV